MAARSKHVALLKYRRADKSLARPWKETSYSDQDLQHYTNTYGAYIYIYILLLFVVSLFLCFSDRASQYNLSN